MIRVTCSEYVLAAFGTQHAVRMRRITLSYMVCMAVGHFFTLAGKQYDFRESNIIEHKKSLSALLTVFVSNILHVCMYVQWALDLRTQFVPEDWS
jgi:dolichol kinase